MQIVKGPVPRLNAADRARAFRLEHGDELRKHNATRMRKVRAEAIPEFIAVDSEGIFNRAGNNHRCVLLGVGEEQYIAKDLKAGLHWTEVFEFLYSQFEAHPKAAFVGFFLSYDFNSWLKTLPNNVAWMLLTKEGMAKRKVTQMGKGKRHSYHPVRHEGWEFDMMGGKRLSLRPRVCECTEHRIKCTHEKPPWMYVCDAGSFFQMSFLSVIHPDMWKDDPDGPVCNLEEWDVILKGKDNRSKATRVTKAMMWYNSRENVLLARVMDRLAKGIVKIGVRLAKDEWYGPGALAAKWLKQQGAPTKYTLPDLMPDWFTDICRKTYYGGWFEIFSHGIIKGRSYNYDINNAYPYATTKLPHLCGDCRYTRGTGKYIGDSNHVLLYVTVSSKSNRIGAVPYRDKHGSILRPARSKGWYWSFELEAATRAGLVKDVEYHEWAAFDTCDHDNPFIDIRRLYNLRLSVGKNGAQGMAIKLNNNSAYGKFAQSTGSAPFYNPFYASYITAHCRTQILDAIATHPHGTDSVLMVATDGICFDSPHPKLPVSKALGEWDYTEYDDLCLFKPGVYWHKQGKEALLKVKSRGVPKQAFQEGIEYMEAAFALMLQRGVAPEGVLWNTYMEETGADFTATNGWPHFAVPVTFRMKSCKQALNERNWDNAGAILQEIWIWQDSDPQNKRRKPRYNRRKRRIDTWIHMLSIDIQETTYYGEEKLEKIRYLGEGFEGSAIDECLTAAVALRNSPARYDLPFHIGYEDNDFEWESFK